MALAKNIQKSYELTKNADFTIGGLQCILLEDKVAGVIGTGLIGKKHCVTYMLNINCEPIFTIHRQKMCSEDFWTRRQGFMF